MVELNHRDRTIKVKIVYYGPPVGGKTTNLQILHRTADARRRGEMISVNSAQDRTILFDLLPLKTAGFRGFDLRLQVLAVPGQAMYAATRRLVLKGADSLVFVANSARDRWEENIQSYREMTTNLLSHHLDPSSMPLVFQYNKRDLPQVMEIEALDRTLNARRADAIPAIAVRGEGVLETFAAILARTVQDLASRYAILDVKGGAPARQWAEEAVLNLFGTRSLKLDSAGNAIAPPPPAAAPGSPSPPPSTAARAPAPPAAAPRPQPVLAGRQGAAPLPIPPPPPPPSGHTVLRVSPAAVSEERPAAMQAPEARATELVESYAEASAQLGAALTELREERDALRQQLQDLRRSMQASQQILDGTPLDAALGPVLAAMARVAGVDHAAFWVTQGNEPPRTVALVGLASDPVLAHAGALRYVSESGTRGGAPAFALAADNLDLGQALEAREGRFAAVLAVPFRTPGGLHGVAAFYYAPDTARPGSERLEQLAEAPRALSAAMELAATLHTVRAAERALELALAGSASLRGLEGVVRSLEQLRDRLGEIRGRADAPSWFLEQYVRLAPALSSALEDGRSLIAFSRGELRCDSVYLDDLLSELRTPEVTVELDPSAEVVIADATLLRLALRAVADEARMRAGSNSAPLAIRAGTWSDGVHITVRADASSADPGRTTALNAGLGLTVARRIIQMHGGALQEPGPEGDSEIVLTLPTP
jgi:signal recognition particle receptor subunit beta